MATITGTRSAGASAVSNIDTGASSHPYTCNTCQVAFRNSDLQKGHMKSDWHRYNLKRRVASLPPISSETFTEKVLQARAASSAEADRVGFQKTCEACQKTYFSENQYRNHIVSAKHRARAAAMLSKSNGKVDDDASSMVTSTFSLGDPTGPNPEVVGSDAEEEFNEVVESLKKTGIHDGSSPVKRPSNPRLSAAAQYKAEHPVSQSSSEQQSTSSTPLANSSSTSTKSEGSVVPTLKSCLFCNYESPTISLSVVHMERIHGMFVPEKQYLVDLEGLLRTLQQRVLEFHECIYCSKVKANSFAVQTHMRDTSHCKIPYTSEEEQLEIGEFYDFRSTYSDAEGDDDDDDESVDGDQQNGGAKLGARRQVQVTGDDGDEIEYEVDNGWETDSSDSSLKSEDLHAVPADQHYHQYERLDKHPHHSREDHRAHHQRDGWHAHNHKRAHAVFYDEYELHLPSGKAVGHRSLNKYYRQNLHDHPSPEERAERLAIEAADAENAMDVDENPGTGRQLIRRDVAAHGRSVVNRETMGLGVTGLGNPDLGKVRKAVEKGRKKEFSGQKRKDLGVSKQYFKEKHRNHATFM